MMTMDVDVRTGIGFFLDRVTSQKNLSPYTIAVLAKVTERAVLLAMFPQHDWYLKSKKMRRIVDVLELSDFERNEFESLMASYPEVQTARPRFMFQKRPQQKRRQHPKRPLYMRHPQTTVHQIFAIR